MIAKSESLNRKIQKQYWRGILRVLEYKFETILVDPKILPEHAPDVEVKWSSEGAGLLF